MKEKKELQAGHADYVARRAFLKKAAVGTVFSMQAIESLAKSDLQVSSALAATATLNMAGTWDIILDAIFPCYPGFHVVQNGSNLTGDLMGSPLTGSITSGAITRTLEGIVTGNRHEWHMGIDYFSLRCQACGRPPRNECEGGETLMAARNLAALLLAGGAGFPLPSPACVERAGHAPMFSVLAGTI